MSKLKIQIFMFQKTHKDSKIELDIQSKIIGI